LIERNRGGLFALFDRHGRSLTGGAQHEQTLHAGVDMKVDELAHHLLIDANFLIEGRNNRQQHSARIILVFWS